MLQNENIYMFLELFQTLFNGDWKKSKIKSKLIYSYMQMFSHIRNTDINDRYETCMKNVFYETDETILFSISN